MKRCLCRVLDVSLSCMPLSVRLSCLSCVSLVSLASPSLKKQPPPLPPPPCVATPPPLPPLSLSRACTLNLSLARALSLTSSHSRARSLARSLCGCRSWEEYMKTGDSKKDEQAPTIAAVLLTL